MVAGIPYCMLCAGTLLRLRGRPNGHLLEVILLRPVRILIRSRNGKGMDNDVITTGIRQDGR